MPFCPRDLTDYYTVVLTEHWDYTVREDGLAAAVEWFESLNENEIAGWIDENLGDLCNVSDPILRTAIVNSVNVQSVYAELSNYTADERSDYKLKQFSD